MFDEPTDDWYEWRTRHSALDDLAAGWLVAAAAVLVLLLAPLLP